MSAATRAGQLSHESLSSRARRKIIAVARARSTSSPFIRCSRSRARCALAISCAVRAWTKVTFEPAGSPCSFSVSRTEPSAASATGFRFSEAARFGARLGATWIGRALPCGVRLGGLNRAVRLDRDASGLDRTHHRDVADAAVTRIGADRKSHDLSARTKQSNDPRFRLAYVRIRACIASRPARGSGQ